ncbi:CsgG/HfaB family protein [Sphingomonas paucimobilis]|uniref:CsgG/HfaB family protein n=2 Tax=Sphingomonas TaxID=13687 RepID=UPI0009FB2D7C|nr:CsgG/HfaB family protein [Sphingomonas paucimobilis]
MYRTIAIVGMLAAAATSASAQKMGKGGIGIDETIEVPRCDRSLGTVALVEERSAASPTDGMPAGMAALIRMAEAQNGGSQRVDPLPLLKLLVAQSGCFQIVDRGEGFDALQRERQLAAGGSVAGANNQATLKAADYLLQAKVLYSDNDSGGSGGGLGSMFPGGLGFKQKVKASQTMLTLVEVKTGIQQAVATGSARKKDLSILGGGLLTNSGIGALGGSYTSTDMGKITSLAMLDALKKLMTQAQGRLAPAAAAAAPAPTPTAPGTAVPAAAPAGVPQR